MFTKDGTGPAERRGWLLGPPPSRGKQYGAELLGLTPHRGLVLLRAVGDPFGTNGLDIADAPRFTAAEPGRRVAADILNRQRTHKATLTAASEQA